MSSVIIFIQIKNCVLVNHNLLLPLFYIFNSMFFSMLGVDFSVMNLVYHSLTYVVITFHRQEARSYIVFYVSDLNAVYATYLRFRSCYTFSFQLLTQCNAFLPEAQ